MVVSEGALGEPDMKRQTDEALDTSWPPTELQTIAATDNLHISPFREDRVTYGRPTWIWSVVVDGELYVRAYHGRQSRWYQAAMRQKGAHSRRRHHERGGVRGCRRCHQ
jgi:hypothetical protein